MLLKANLKDCEEKMIYFPKTKSRDAATETPELPFGASRLQALLQCLLLPVYSTLLCSDTPTTLSPSTGHMLLQPELMEKT